MMKNFEDALKRCELDFEDRIKNDNILLTGRIDIEILQETLKEYKILKEKATPKEVIVDDSEYDKYGESDYKCPSCNSWLRPDIFMEKHCCNCGQALKWSEQMTYQYKRSSSNGNAI